MLDRIGAGLWQNQQQAGSRRVEAHLSLAHLDAKARLVDVGSDFALAAIGVIDDARGIHAFGDVPLPFFPAIVAQHLSARRPSQLSLADGGIADPLRTVSFPPTLAAVGP
jgi:hypothetical protein